ncbi:hypothetical protein B0H17DRAFT_1213495 [Mycena rosella]|uniref:Uncharacterized protein n=1 Tax=Mycena rosella TaxID=1033263 RepID=A0AAD7CQ05_MYCRO|nr:hypothetical protein B0H17DRAFT_1213495 [Mycena rosella]
MDADMANVSNAIDVDQPELETRVFSTPCLHSYHGYDRLPSQIDDALKFRLPQILFYHSRLIAIADRRFLVWSPNSTQDPYYPGVVTDVEYTPVYSVWDNPVLAGGHGRLNPTYLRDLSIRFNDILGQVTVDKLAACQRGIREQRAWLDMVELLISRPPLTVQCDVCILPADEDYIGVWINGGVEETIHWLLTMAHVPCFVIHAFCSDKLVADAISDPLSRTDIRLLTDKIGNEHDRLLLRGADGLHPEAFTPEELYPVPRSLVYRQPREREGSSLSWQLELPDGQRIPREVLHDPGTLEEQNLALRACIVRDFRQRTPDRYLGPGATDFIADTERRFAAYESDFPAKTPLLYQALLTATAVGEGKWTMFRKEDREPEEEDEEEESDLTAMMELGARNQGKNVVVGEELWFDRIKRRRLIFTDLPPLDPLLGLTTEKSTVARSRWMYRKQDPEPLYKGRVAKTPRAQQLPLLKDGSHEPNDSKWAWKTETENEGDPKVSLGESGGSEDEGPVVPPLSVAPSHVPLPSKRKLWIASASRRATSFTPSTKGHYSSVSTTATFSPSTAESIHFLTDPYSSLLTVYSATIAPTAAELRATGTEGPPYPDHARPHTPGEGEAGRAPCLDGKVPLVRTEDVLPCPIEGVLRRRGGPTQNEDVAMTDDTPSLLLHFADDEAGPPPGLLGRFTEAQEDVVMEEGEIFHRFGVGLPERVGKIKKPRIRRHNRTGKREARQEREHLSWLTLEEHIFQDVLFRDARAQPPPPPPPERTYERDDNFYDTDDE